MRKYDNGFQSCFSDTVTSSPALFSSYQNKKHPWDEVSIYTVTLVLELSFPNTRLKYNASHFY